MTLAATSKETSKGPAVCLFVQRKQPVLLEPVGSDGDGAAFFLHAAAGSEPSFVYRKLSQTPVHVITLKYSSLA